MSKSMRIIGSSAHTSEERQSRDYYATDPQALIDFLKQFYTDGETIDKTQIWEPSCGEGNLSKVLAKHTSYVKNSDIYDYGNNEVLNFLEYSGQWSGDILTNPPYKIGQKFIEKALELIENGNKVIMLMRSQFLESKRRYPFFKKTKPKFVYIHSSRIKIFKNNDQKKYTGAQPLCYAWYIWEKGYEGEPIIRWIP